MSVTATRTLVLCKPDAVERGLVGEIVSRIERRGMTIVAMDLRTIDAVGGYMEGQTICALSDAAAWAATGFLRRFRAEFEQHVRERRCPLPGSFET